LLTIEAQALCQVALWIQIDQECSNSHLGKTKTIRGGYGALSGPPLKVEEELFSYGFEWRRKPKRVPILADIFRLIITFSVRIPLCRRKDSLRLFLKELVFRNPEEFCKGHRRVDCVFQNLSLLNRG
jgi:hypothetical protein